MLDPNARLNPWEQNNGVHVACATNRSWVSNHPSSVTYQIVDRFGVHFHSTEGRSIEEIGWVFSTDKFDFTDSVRARAYAIVCHKGWDMRDQDYTQADIGLAKWLELIHSDWLVVNKHKTIREIQSLRWDIPSLLTLEGEDFLLELERAIQDTRSRIDPLVRIALMARWLPEEMQKLLHIMHTSPTNLVLYTTPWNPELRATVLKFPWLFREIPALADEELQLAA